MYLRRLGARWSLAATTAAILVALSACASSGSSGTAASKKPIVIGTSLSLSGDFSADGQAFERGYKMWAAYQNAHGGLLGRPVHIQVLSDASSPTQVVTNYQDLITRYKDPLIFGDFSTLLAVPAQEIAHRFGYLLIDGAGAGVTAFAHHFTDYFNTSPPVTQQLVPLAKWLASLPPAQRPKTAAWPTSDDPFTYPMFPAAMKITQAAGIKTVYYKIFPSEVTDYTPLADAVISSHAQAVILGDQGDATMPAFMQAFQQANFNPKVFVGVNDPGTGSAFTKQVGVKNAEGIMAPGQWYPGTQNALSKSLVKTYLAKYGGTASAINADIAESYSVGEVMAAAVKATHSLNNAKLIAWLHSGVTIPTVQGDVKFNSQGQTFGGTYIFQWQHGKYVQVLPSNAPGSTKVEFPKPTWGS